MQTWKWAIATSHGVYDGEVAGELEPGETSEDAMKIIAPIATSEVTALFPDTKILACFVTDGNLFISCPQQHTLLKLDREKEVPLGSGGLAEER